jgi:hypothetical protein
VRRTRTCGASPPRKAVVATEALARAAVPNDVKAAPLPRQPGEQRVQGRAQARAVIGLEALAPHRARRHRQGGEEGHGAKAAEGGPRGGVDDVKTDVLVPLEFMALVLREFDPARRVPSQDEQRR